MKNNLGVDCFNIDNDEESLKHIDAFKILSNYKNFQFLSIFGKINAVERFNNVFLDKEYISKFKSVEPKHMSYLSRNDKALLNFEFFCPLELWNIKLISEEHPAVWIFAFNKNINHLYKNGIQIDRILSDCNCHFDMSKDIHMFYNELVNFITKKEFDISDRAKNLWQNNGYKSNKDLEYWLRAEREILYQF